MSQDLMKNDGVAIADWKSPELILDDEDPDAIFADETAHHCLTGRECLAAGADGFLDGRLTHPIFLLICCNLERECVMLL